MRHRRGREAFCIIPRVTVEEGSMVIDSVVMPGAKIGKNVVIERAIVGSEMVIEDGTIIRPEKMLTM